MSLVQFAFVCLDSIMKMLVETYPVGMLVTVRNLAQVLVLLGLAPLIGSSMFQTRRWAFHGVRGACVVATTSFVTLALAHMPMAETYTISFSAPLMATVIAFIALGERPRVMQWAMILFGFMGVVVALRPAASGAGLFYLLPLAMAVANALVHVLTRYGSRNEGPATLVFWAGLAAFVICIAGLPLCYAPLSARATLLLLLGGTLGTFGHVLMAAAFQFGQTLLISPLIYSQILWAAMLGYLVFGEIPASSTLIGAALVAASGLVLVRDGARP
jgi:drug/metabolite transporter (DMT)-like permease